MKKIYLSLFFIILGVLNVFGTPFEYMSRYRIPSYDTVEEYNYLVGKTITFIPLANAYNLKMVNKFFYIRDFEVLKVKNGRSQKWKAVKRMLWTIKDVKTNEKFEISIYIGDKTLLKENYAVIEWDDEVRIMDIPFYDMSEWKKDCSQLLGSIYTHPLVKSQYKVKKIDFEVVNGQYEEIIEVENTIDHSKHKYRRETVLEDCFKEDLKKDFFTRLAKVEKPENPDIQFGEIEVITDSLKKFFYEDNYISFVVYGTPELISFILGNKTQHSLKILWDEASFVDIYGTTSKIIHKGINFADCEKPQSPSVIIRGATIEEKAIPKYNVYYSNADKDWRLKTYYPNEPSEECKQVKLMLPIQIKGVTNEYLFVFDIIYDYVHPERLKIGN